MKLIYNKADLIRLPVGSYVEIVNMETGDLENIGMIKKIGAFRDQLHFLVQKVDDEKYDYWLRPEQLKNIKE